MGKAENADIEKISSSNIVWKGNVKEESVLVFTIPNESGWRAYIDGQKVETITVIDYLMGVKLPAGEHIVEIRYIPVGMKTGVAVTFASLFAYLALAVIKKLKKRIK